MGKLLLIGYSILLILMPLEMPSQEVTFREIIQASLSRSPEILNSQAALKQAELNFFSLQHSLKPSLSFQSSLGYSGNYTFFNSLDSSLPFSAGFNFSLPLLFSVNAILLQKSDLTRRQRLAEIEEAENLRVYSTILLCLDLLSLRDQLALLKESQEAYRNFYEAIKLKISLGAGTSTDLLYAGLKVEELGGDISAVEEKQRSIINQFSAFCGFTPPENIDISLLLEALEKVLPHTGEIGEENIPSLSRTQSMLQSLQLDQALSSRRSSFQLNLNSSVEYNISPDNPFNESFLELGDYSDLAFSLSLGLKFYPLDFGKSSKESGFYSEILKDYSRSLEIEKELFLLRIGGVKERITQCGTTSGQIEARLEIVREILENLEKEVSFGSIPVTDLLSIQSTYNQLKIAAILNNYQRLKYGTELLFLLGSLKAKVFL